MITSIPLPNNTNYIALKISQIMQQQLRWLQQVGFCMMLVIAGSILWGEDSAAQSIAAYLSTDSVRVGDRFFLTLVATHESAERPLFPDTDANAEVFGDLEVIGVTSSGTSQREGLNFVSTVDSLIYEVTTFALDTAYVPSIPVFFVAGSDTSFYASRPLELPVVSLVTDDADAIRDLTPIVEFPRNIWPWIIGLLLLSACIIGLIVYLSKRRPMIEQVVLRAPPPVVPPYEEAIRRLRALEKTANLKDLHEVKRYYVELTEALRVYLGRRLKIGAMEEASNELLNDINRLAHENKLPDQAAYLIRRILHVADLVKFADMYPRPEVGHQALVETRNVLDLVEGTFKTVPEQPVEEKAPPVTSNEIMEEVKDE